MISAQSLLLQLNGSKIVWFVLVVVMITSCRVTKRDDNTVVLQPGHPTEVIEDVSEEVVEEEIIEEVEEKVDVFFEDTQELNVLVLAPFLDKNGERYIEFYEGFKMAARQNGGAQLPWHIRTLNCSHNANSPQIRDEVANADIIIGPYWPDDIESISMQVVGQQKILLSPWVANRNRDDGEHYIQLSAGLDRHIEVIMEHAFRTYLPSQMLMVGKKSRSDEELFVKINEGLIETYGFGSQLETYTIDNVNDKNTVDELSARINLDSLNPIKTVIVPHWKDASFLMTLMGRLNVVSHSEDEVPLRVYCMNRLLSADPVDFSTLESLDVYIPSTKGDHFDTPNSRLFRREYFVDHHISPGREAYLGHDTYQLIEMIAQDLIDGKRPSGTIECGKCFNKIVLDNRKKDEYVYLDEEKPYQLNIENRGVSLLEFINYRFVPIEDN